MIKIKKTITIFATTNHTHTTFSYKTHFNNDLFSIQEIRFIYKAHTFPTRRLIPRRRFFVRKEPFKHKDLRQGSR